MYFCPKCSYSLDVSKIDKGNEKTKEMLPLSTSNLKKIKKNNLDIEDYNLDFNIQDVEKNSYYKKLKKEEKIILKNLLAWSLEREVNTVGDTIITKNNIAPSKIEFKYDIASNNIFYR